MTHPNQPYPGQQYGQPAPQPYTPPRKKSNAWKWLLGIALGSLVLCGGGLAVFTVLGVGAVNEVVNEQNAKKSDVEITSCTSKPNQFVNSVEVGYKITNSGDSKRTYIVTLAVNDAAGNRLGETVGTSLDLNAGQSTTGTSPVLLDSPEHPGKVTCVLLDVA